ncbi:MAG TPA: 3-hydroxyacyl-CoA dehydrogenase family protein [Ignavibacteria bacterium]|nr:3-hydroxyacyl-CoA dehydrogenase family protein [Ignavibacteria bacterium]
MAKVFIIGDNEKLIEELSGFLSEKHEVSDALDGSTELIFEVTNYDREIKFNNLNYLQSTNTNSPIVSSSLCITLHDQLRAFTNPARLLGVGLYPSFSEADGIEVSNTKLSSQDHFSTLVDALTDLGKEVHHVEDRPGMVNLRVVTLIMNEAYQVLQEGTSNREDIDTAMKLGTNYPHGPIEWSEKIGIDLVYHILESMYNNFGDDRYRITPLLREMYLESKVQS